MNWLHIDARIYQLLKTCKTSAEFVKLCKAEFKWTEREVIRNTKGPRERVLKFLDLTL